MKIKLLLALASLAFYQPASATIIDLYSGNGVIGGTDSKITFLQGPANSAFANAFTASDFLAAKNGLAAPIINSHPAWVSEGLDSIGGNAAAQWISDKSTGAAEGSSALYAVNFDISFAAIDTGILNFYWSVDNLLGGGPNTGVYLNGTAVPGISGGTFGSRFFELGTDVSSLLVNGTNTLYINATDTGGPGGLMFSASFNVTEDTTNPNSVPAPAPLALISLGLVAIGYSRNKQSVQ